MPWMKEKHYQMERFLITHFILQMKKRCQSVRDDILRLAIHIMSSGTMMNCGMSL